MALTDLARTQLHLIGLEGCVTRRTYGYIAETPQVPTFFYGTCVILDNAPASWEQAHEWHRDSLGEDVGHRMIVWGGEAPSKGLQAAARAAGYVVDSSASMAMDSPPPAGDVTGVRPLTLADWRHIEELSIACDASEGEDGDPEYQVFRTGVRALNRAWIEAGSVTWWGVFIDGELVGQCGFAVCDSEVGAGLGRFQAVEVHPEHRRRGIAGRLVGAVARHGFLGLGCRRLILEADPEGPAVGLYKRLGFYGMENEHSLLWSRSKIHVRAESASDHADLRALAIRVTGDQQLASQLDQSRAQPGYQGWVAERDGKILGHLGREPVARDTSPLPTTPDTVDTYLIRRSAADTGVEEALEHGAH